MSELLPVPGVTCLDKIPESLRSVIRYATGILVAAQHPQEAKALLECFASLEAAPEVAKSGFEPLARQ